MIIFMKEIIICQGRKISHDDLNWINQIIKNNSEWSRHKIATEICTQWNWYTSNGQLKDFAARSLLLKLQQKELVKLPALRKSMKRPRQKIVDKLKQVPQQTSINALLTDLKPLQVIIPQLGSQDSQLFDYYLHKFHYLGFNRTVGENIKYLIRGRDGQDLACLLFGSAAWKTAPRDQFIGWKDSNRIKNLNLITNNTRFLILPWVDVSCLASHILGLILRRLNTDWNNKYAHPIHLVETFVQNDRFLGTCYQASNWIRLGQTKGRSRQDRYTKLSVPPKDVYIYPLNSRFKRKLIN